MFCFFKNKASLSFFFLLWTLPWLLKFTSEPLKLGGTLPLILN